MSIFTKQSTADGSETAKKSEATFGITILATSLADAQLLMMTAAERGIQLDDTVTRAILDADEALGKNQITPEIANSFWHAYETISNSLSPITIDSVRATHDLRQLRSGIWGYLQGKMYVPFSRKSAFRYKLLSLITLLALIALQVFWAIGNTLVVDIKDLSDRIAKLETALFDSGSANSFGNGSDLSTRLSAQNQALGSSSQRASSSAPETSSSSADTQEINRQIGEYISWRSAEIIELKNWNRFWGNIVFFSEQSWEKPEYSDLSEEAKTHVHFVSAQYVLHAISAYLLPILYGLLGASFYVLRQLPKDIENLTFSMNSHIDYSLRITQGPLAGIMASFFFTETPVKLYSLTSESSAITTFNVGSSSLADFSPLAIAFIAGYSVELIFYVIDKIIKTITAQTPPPAPPVCPYAQTNPPPAPLQSPTN